METTPTTYGRLRIERQDLAPARWLEKPSAETGESFFTPVSVCAPGFPAYARILHPAELAGRPVRWDEVASAYDGRTVTGATRWHELIGLGHRFDLDNRDLSRPGVWDHPPKEGPTPAALAHAMIPVLARHTRTPDRCWFGLWAGYGQYDWTGVPVFETPGREEILLAGRLSDAASPAEAGEADPDCPWPDELPDLWWPEDRAWCVGGDTDLFSTYVGGSESCIAELLATPGLEAHRAEQTDPLD
ncbi:hypothetical protein [Streptomyces beijiangensis]|uniref:Uncharacterized protein n=1 Tax=Streptomyces beijiangensis TaxID=163361 RepID=A0A939JHV5_9ACTN|nr:hypothetical protein [Streptomyces beijiangensis]MBO0511924.1 hypothetical protein [Streptomyces beijiangensis]